MSSVDDIEDDCNGQADDLEKESRKKYSYSKCDKVFLHFSSFSRHGKPHSKLNLYIYIYIYIYIY